MMRALVVVLLLFTVCLAETGCVSTRPVHYYALGEPSPPSNPSKPDGPILLVGKIETPEPLQDGRIRYRTGSNEVGYYEYNRWTERPGIIVGNELSHALRDSGKYQRVLDATSSAIGDYLLRGKLDRFEEVDQASIQTEITIQVELMDRKTNQIIWNHMVKRDEPVKNKTIPDVVQSFDQNLHQVVNEVVVELDKFLTGRR